MANSPHHADSRHWEHVGPWLLSPLITAAFAVSLALVLLTGLVTHGQFNRLQRERARLYQVDLIRAATIEEGRLVDDAETGQRGYLLTGDRSYLGPYERAVRLLPSRMERMRALATAEPALQQDVANLESVIRRKLAELKETIQLHDRSGPDAARSVVAAGEGRRLMEDAEALFARIEQEEDAAQSRWFAASETDARRTSAALAVLTVLGLLPIIGAMLLVNAGLRQRLAAEQETSKQAILLRSILDTVGDGVTVADADGHLILRNPAAARIVGSPFAREPGKAGWAVLYGLFREDGVTHISQEELPLACALRGEHVDGMKMLIRPPHGGEPRWVSVSARPLLGDHARPRGAVVITRDTTDEGKAIRALQAAHDSLEARVRERTADLEQLITEHERTETELRRSQSLFRDFQAHNSALAFIRDEGLRLVYANAAYERFFGSSLEELAQRSVSEVISPATADRLLPLYQRVLETGERLELHEVVPDQHGKPHELFVSLFPIRSDDGEVSLGGLAMDVTQQRHLEQQLQQAQKMEVVGQLAGGIAHDFNNLITIISGYSELALLGLEENHPLHVPLEQILKAGERAASLTRQLLAFSRRQVMAARVLDLNATVRDTETMLRRLIGEDVRLSSVFAPKLPAVRADPSQVEQILMNLAVNARDAMPHGGRLTLETGWVELDEAYASRVAECRPGRYVVLSVTDTGCGMDPETLSHVFEPFFTTKPIGKGTGLGLATVFGIVKQSGGHITVYSEPGHGTTFRIYLPAAEQPELPETAEPERVEIVGQGERILLVEDEDALRALARRTLEDHGYQVVEAGSGKEALAVAAACADPIDLLMTDVVMPDLGGRPLAEELVASRPGLRVLYVSGYTTDTVVRHGVLEEGVAFLQKPFTVASLLRAVRAALEPPLDPPLEPPPSGDFPRPAA